MNLPYTQNTPETHRELHRPISRHTSLLSWQVLHFLTANRWENTCVLQAYLPRTETYSCRSVRNAHTLRIFVLIVSSLFCERRFGASQRKFWGLAPLEG